MIPCGICLSLSDFINIKPSKSIHVAVLCLVTSVMSNFFRPRGLLCPWGFSRQEYWSGLPCSPPGDFPNPGMECRSLALQADSLLSEPPAKPKSTSVGSPSLLQGIFPTQGSPALHWILYQLSYQGSPCCCKWQNFFKCFYCKLQISVLKFVVQSLA